MSQQQLKSCPLPWLYIHFPCLQLDGLIEHHEQQNLQPLIIVNSKTNQVKQLNKLAFEQGIKVNMGIASAIALAPDLMVLDYQPDSEVRQLKALAQRLYQITADIILYQPNGLLLQVQSMLNLYGSLQNYWGKVVDILKRHPLHYTWALADTPTAARLLAKYDGQSNTQLPSQNQEKARAHKALGQLSVTCLEINEKHIEQLQRLGLARIEQLWGLSNKAIGRRFGLELLNYLQQLKQHSPKALGADDTIIPFKPAQHYQQSIELLHEINQASILLFPLKRMAQDMESFLLTRQLLVHEITITLHFRLLAPTTLTIASAEGEYQTEPWMRLIGLKVEQCKLPDSVIAISFSCGTLVAKQRHNSALFGTQDTDNQQVGSLQANSHKLTPHQLVSILEAKIGKSHLFTLALKDDHRPECSASYLPANYLSGSDLSGSYLSKNLQSPLLTGNGPIPLPWQRPTLLLYQPVPLPAGYHIITGPERVSRAWWQQSPHHQAQIDAYQERSYRDYYIGKDNLGTLCWIYHEPNTGWFVQGYFS